MFLGALCMYKRKCWYQFSFALVFWTQVDCSLIPPPSSYFSFSTFSNKTQNKQAYKTSFF